MDVPATKVSATRTCPDLPGDLPYRLEEFSPDDIEYELEEMESRNLRLIENWQASGIFLWIFKASLSSLEKCVGSP